MGFQDFLIDAKNIILGKADEENTIDFKQEIDKCVKSGLITKAEAAEMIQTFNNQKKEAKAFDKKQISTISLEDGSVVSEEEIKKKKEELERKKREKEQQRRIAAENAKQQVKAPNSKTNLQSKSGKITIDRNKLQRAMQNDEDIEKNYRKQEERDGKN